MDDTTEVIRKEMDETASDMVEKIEMLESQVSDVVESTSTAVSETVASVQDTVSNVTDSVQGGVQSVVDFMDLPRHVDRHPWLVLGGAFVVGYVASEFLGEQGAGSQRAAQADTPRNGSSEARSEPSGRSMSSSIGEVAGSFNGALTGALLSFVTRGVNNVLESLTGEWGGDSQQRSAEESEERRDPQ